MTEEQTLTFQKIMMDCAAKEKTTRDDLDEFYAQKPPTSQNAKCFRACMSETFGAVSYISIQNYTNKHFNLKYLRVKLEKLNHN